MAPRNLIVCCDGTWNSEDQKINGIPVPTNVVRFYNSLAAQDCDGNPQLRYYHPGVGTEGAWWEKLMGGGLGVGLGKNIQSGYRWLAANYCPGDRIALIGFSRGAFTARSLGGMITRCGLLKLNGLAEGEAWKRVGTAYQKCYRKRGQDQFDPDWCKDWAFHRDASDGPVGINFVGVWDTVGALGVPDDMAVLNVFDRQRKYAFHDTTLSDRVRHARHAVALDEQRAAFTPTLWTNTNKQSVYDWEDGTNSRSIKQRWFPGVHCDVGGGYAECGLSDGALHWMIEEAKACGVGFDQAVVDQIKPDFRGVLHDSLTGAFKVLRTQPRSVPKVEALTAVHQSVIDRCKAPPISQMPYRRTFSLAVGRSIEVPIYANQHWNDTGLYLEQNARYEFVANGQWLDATIKCTPAGTDRDAINVGKIAQWVGSLLGQVEKVCKRITNNERADVYGSRREEDMPWFALVGVIANGGNPKYDGTPESHETFLIGNQASYPKGQANPAGSGYLYCFANDSWHFYGNNRGSVILKVTRTH